MVQLQRCCHSDGAHVSRDVADESQPVPNANLSPAVAAANAAAAAASKYALTQHHAAHGRALALIPVRSTAKNTSWDYHLRAGGAFAS